MSTISYLIIFGTLLLSGLLGLFMIPQILSYCKRNNHFDRKDERKIHVTNIPRLGGMSFLPSMLLSFVIALLIMNYTQMSVTVNTWSIGVVVGMVIVYLTGLVDDYEELTPNVKFLAQFVAATMLPICGLYMNNLYGLFGIYEISPWIGIPLTIYLVMFVNNSINLIDGIDGLCASLCVIGFGGFLTIFISEGLQIYSTLIAGIIGVLLAYLYFNLFGSTVKGTKIFMGDSGSLLLGYMLSFLALKVAVYNENVFDYHNYSLLLPLTLVLVPTFDVVRVILARMRNHAPLSSPDKRHIHHKLMAAGCTQHEALGIIVGMQLAFMGLNYALYICDINTNIILLVDVVIFTLAHIVIDLMQKEEN